MKNILLISVLAVIAWYGLTRYKNVREYPAEVSGPYTKTVEYAKCTTADGRVIYGQPPSGTTCKTIENITNEITISPRETVIAADTAVDPVLDNRLFQCDGRKYCSQMSSREEAEFFIKNCPNTEMDGDDDGIPCENDSRF